MERINYTEGEIDPKQPLPAAGPKKDIMSAPGSETEKYRDKTRTKSCPDFVSVDIVAEFWQQWEEHRDGLYWCCLKIMNYNHIDAEDALSWACLKAWEKVQKFAGKIDKLKSWLFALTRNLCVDIIRERSQDALGVDSIEWVDQTNTIATALVSTPEGALENSERSNQIQRAIADLPQTLRDTFVMHFYQEQTHQEIAQEQGISYNTVCQRISRARKQLKQKLSGYFLGEEGEAGTIASAHKQSPTLPREKEKQKKIEPEEKKAFQTATDTTARESVSVAEKSFVHSAVESVGEVDQKISQERANQWARRLLPTPPIQGEKQKIRCDNLRAKETARDTAVVEWAQVADTRAQTQRKPPPWSQVVKEKPFVNGEYASSWSSWRENFFANDRGELLRWRKRVFLPTATSDETKAERVGAIETLAGRLRSRLIWHFYGELTYLERLEQHSWIAPAMVEKAGFLAKFDTG